MSEHPETCIALAIGSNIGDRLEALRAAIKAMQPYITVTTVSPVYETAAAYVAAQPAYLNAALTGTTQIEPLALLWMLKDIESEIGRLPTFRYGPRLIDIDIVFYGDLILETQELSIPHLRMGERDFVLRPLNDIAPDWVHPQNGKTVAQLLAALPGNDMTALGDLLCA